MYIIQNNIFVLSDRYFSKFLTVSIDICFNNLCVCRMHIQLYFVYQNYSGRHQTIIKVTPQATDQLRPDIFPSSFATGLSGHMHWRGDPGMHTKERKTAARFDTHFLIEK